MESSASSLHAELISNARLVSVLTSLIFLDSEARAPTEIQPSKSGLHINAGEEKIRVLSKACPGQVALHLHRKL